MGFFESLAAFGYAVFAELAWCCVGLAAGWCGCLYGDHLAPRIPAGGGSAAGYLFVFLTLGSGFASGAFAAALLLYGTTLMQRIALCGTLNLGLFLGIAGYVYVIFKRVANSMEKGDKDEGGVAPQGDAAARAPLVE